MSSAQRPRALTFFSPTRRDALAQVLRKRYRSQVTTGLGRFESREQARQFPPHDGWPTLADGKKEDLCTRSLDFAKVFASSVFYGAYCVLMIIVLNIQLTSRYLLPTHKLLLYMSDIMFLLSSSHISLLLYECFTGTVPPRVLQAAVAIAQLQIALGDTVLVWRVWVVWNRDLRIVTLPTLALLCGFVVGMIYAAEAKSYTALSKILPVPSTILGVINTALCTALIVGRLAYLDRLINGHLAFGAGRDHTYRGIILMMIESGAALTIASTINLILERLKHPGLHVMLNITTPLAGIVPTTIIVLSHLHLAPGDTANETVTVHFATRFEDSAVFPGPRNRPSPGQVAADTEICELTMTRSGTSLDFPPDVEKHHHSFGTSTSPGCAALGEVK